MNNIKKGFIKFPKQFWILMIGSIIFTTGSSLVWPFLNIYIQGKLNIPLRYSTLLISLRAISGIIASFFFAGTFADKFGRRLLMLISLCGGFFYYLGLKNASTFWHFAVLMTFWGMLDIFYPVGLNAMIADIISQENRLEAYSILRVVYNTGYAIGPILGGFMAARSYDRIFVVAAIGYAFSFVFMLFTTKETLTESNRMAGTFNNRDFGISVVFRDKFFILSVVLNGMIYITSAGVFNLLSLYARQNFGIAENMTSFVFTVNALMCVTLQLVVIRFTKGNNPLKLMSLSGLLYMLGVSSIALVDKVWWYCICMAVMTIGELIMSPTMSDLTAELAPVDARGRYMSVLSLARPFGQGIGPAILGYVNDMISPRMMWIIGSMFAGISCCAFFIMNKKVDYQDRLRRK